MVKTSCRVKELLEEAGNKGLTTREIVDILLAPFPTISSYVYRLYKKGYLCRTKYLPFRYYCLDYLNEIRNIGLYKERKP
jgi:hypothetical protein